MTKVYEELIDFIAAGVSVEQVAGFAPSEAARTRVWELVRREKDGSLTTDETRELTHYAELEHLLRVAKARARQRLQAAVTSK